MSWDSGRRATASGLPERSSPSQASGGRGLRRAGHAAWYRFVSIEVPGTISQVGQAPASSAGQPAAPLGQQAATEGQPVTAAGQPHPAASSQPYRAAGGPPFAAPAGQAYGTPTGQAYGTPYGQPFAVPAANWQYPRAGAGLLIFGLVCGIISLFPAYLGGASLASVAENSCRTSSTSLPGRPVRC